MGYSISWLAVKKDYEPQLLQQLGLARTGEREDVPESDLLVVDLPSGWFVLWSNDLLFAEQARQQLKDVSEVITCSVEEHVMHCEVTYHEGGKRTWSVTHDAHLSIDHLDVQGSPPAALDPIRERLQKEQQGKDDVDFTFSIPVELAEEITGFAYDSEVPGTTEDDEPFEVIKALSDGFVASNQQQKTGCLGLVAISGIVLYTIWSVA